MIRALLIGLAASDTFLPTANAAECAIALGAGSTTMATSEGHAGAVLKDGSVWMWGANNFGQLGNGTTNATANPTPIQVGGISNAVALAAGIHHTVVLLDTGQLKAWGRNNFGQLGNGLGTADSLTPADVATLPQKAVAVAAGDHFTTVLLENGRVMSWGINREGQLGIGTTDMSPHFIPVEANWSAHPALIGTVKTITARFRQTLVILEDGGATGGPIWGWGENSGGAFGDGTTTAAQPSPTQASGITTAIAVSAGDHHTAAILADGTMRTWGRNFEGALGRGFDSGADSPLPVQVVDIGVTLPKAIAVSTGDLHTIALLEDNTVWVWGRGNDGQLGNNTTIKSNKPVQAIGITTATAIRGGGLSTYALLADGTIKSWGENTFGQLGDNNASTDAKVPVSVVNINPCPPDDPFSIEPSIQGADLLLTWPSAPGQTFQVEHHPTLDPGTPWTPLVTNLPAAAGSFTTYLHSNALAAPRGFYRVLRLP